MPFLLIGIAISSFGLPWPWPAVMLGAQGFFYGLAMIDWVVPAGTAFKRLTSLIRTFVVLMIAAASAASILFQPDKDFWTVTRIGVGKSEQ